jgi:4-amino-4-deoxy-L-arabinose transferase-like glycosyltransferase
MNASSASMSLLNERRRNSALWLGLVLTIVALLSQGLFFFKVPGQNALPWLNLALGTVAVLMVTVGVKRAFAEPQRYRGKVAGSIITVVSIFLFAITVFGFVSARKLPAASGAPQIGQKAPDFTLPDINGKSVSLAQLLSTPGNSHPKAVLLVFYRGYW